MYLYGGLHSEGGVDAAAVQDSRWRTGKAEKYACRWDLPDPAGLLRERTRRLRELRVRRAGVDGGERGNAEDLKCP